MTTSQPAHIYLMLRDPNVGAGLLAKAARQPTQLYRVHIHCCGNGHLWFRSYSGSLSKSRNAGPESLSNSGQRGLTGRLRSKTDQDQERLASHRSYRRLLQPKKLCRYLCPDEGVSVTKTVLTHRYREQAPSHIGGLSAVQRRDEATVCGAVDPGLIHICHLEAQALRAARRLLGQQCH